MFGGLGEGVMSEPMARPTAIPVIGWGWVAIGLLMAFSGVMGLMGSAFGVSSRAARGGPTTPFDFVFDHFAAFTAVQIVIGAFITAGAAALLRNKRWGARVIRVAAWCGILFMIAFTTYFLSEVFRFPAPPPEAGVSRSYMITFFFLAVVFTVLFQGAPLVLTLYFLGRENVRSALK